MRHNPRLSRATCLRHTGRRDSSAFNLDRDEILVLVLFYRTKPLSDERGEEIVAYAHIEVPKDFTAVYRGGGGGGGGDN